MKCMDSDKFLLCCFSLCFWVCFLNIVTDWQVFRKRIVYHCHHIRQLFNISKYNICICYLSKNIDELQLQMVWENSLHSPILQVLLHAHALFLPQLELVLDSEAVPGSSIEIEIVGSTFSHPTIF